MTRKLHQSIDLVLAALGIVLTIGSVAVTDVVSLQVQVGWIVLGILLVEAGVGGFASQYMTNDRRFLRLRQEGDRTLALIRELNAAAVARDKGLEDETRFRETLEEMHSTVRRMADLATLEGRSRQDSLREEVSTTS